MMINTCECYLIFIQDICEGDEPLDIECRQIGTKIPHDQTGQVFESTANCNLQRGLACGNVFQQNGRCFDYEIRYCCPKKKSEKMIITTIY